MYKIDTVLVRCACSL